MHACTVHVCLHCLLYCSIAVCTTFSPWLWCVVKLHFSIQEHMRTHTFKKSNICCMQTLQSECVLAVQHCLLYQSDQSYCKQYRANNIHCPFVKGDGDRKEKQYKIFFCGICMQNSPLQCYMINSVLVGWQNVAIVLWVVTHSPSIWPFFMSFYNTSPYHIHHWHKYWWIDLCDVTTTFQGILLLLKNVDMAKPALLDAGHFSVFYCIAFTAVVFICV